MNKPTPPESSARLLVVDDEESMRVFLKVMLTKEGYDVVTARDGLEAVSLYERHRFDLVLEDLKMPGLDGIEVLRRLKELDEQVLIIIMTAYSTWNSAVEAMRLGAYDYIKKPFDNRDIKATVARAINVKRQFELSKSLTDADISPVTNIIGRSDNMQEIYTLIRLVAPTDSTVLIQGESGTGKELVARALHYGSLRREQTFLTLNCGAFPEGLLESELFGHLRGSFTGAVQDKRGLLEVADNGTVFLDEVGDMSLALQAKFLRVLENREFYPVGSTAPTHVDVRFITATNKDLRRESANKNFREDLYYRLNVIPIDLPPLRERLEDIPLLSGHFLAKSARSTGNNVTSFTEEAMQALMTHDWPGNVRELQNVIQRAVTLCEAEQVGLVDIVGRIPSMPQPSAFLCTEIPAQGLDIEEKLREIEKSYMKAALQRCDGHMTNAAKLLKMSFRSFRYKVKKFGLRD
jgi:two-component system response regulator PilR (NtrC family)